MFFILSGINIYEIGVYLNYANKFFKWINNSFENFNLKEDLEKKLRSLISNVVVPKSLFEEILPRWNIDVSFVDMTNLENVKNKIRKN